MSLEGSEIYQLRFWLNKVSPLISRRFLVKSESNLADLHYLIQISMGWDNSPRSRKRVKKWQCLANVV